MQDVLEKSSLMREALEEVAGFSLVEESHQYSQLTGVFIPAPCACLLDFFLFMDPPATHTLASSCMLTRGLGAMLELAASEIDVTLEKGNFQVNRDNAQDIVAQAALVSPEKHLRDVGLIFVRVLKSSPSRLAGLFFMRH